MGKILFGVLGCEKRGFQGSAFSITSVPLITIDKAKDRQAGGLTCAVSIVLD